MKRWLVKNYEVWPATPSSFPAMSDIVIINWVILGRHAMEMQCITWDIIIADEVYFAKSMKAKRTKAMLSLTAGIKVALKARRY